MLTNNDIKKIIIIAALIILWPKISDFIFPTKKKKKEGDPEIDDIPVPELDISRVCEHVIYEPLSLAGYHGSNFLPRGYCLTGDSFFDDKPYSTGDKFADEQANEYESNKKSESEIANMSSIAIILNNTTSDESTMDILNTTDDNDVFTPVAPIIPPDAPVATSATDITESSFSANWNPSTGATGYHLDVATDSAFTSFVLGFENKDVGDAQIYSVTGLSEYTDYFYRVRAYNNSGSSDNSNTENIKTYFAFLLTSTGDGSGVSTLQFETSEDVTVTLNGTAKFYTNAGGTDNESNTWDVTAGALRTIYLKCPSGTANMNVSDITKLIKWGNQDNEGWVSGANAAYISGDISILALNCTHVRVTLSNTLSGNVANLTSLTYLYVTGINTLSGSIAGLTNLTYLYLGGNNTVSGSIAGLINLTFVNLGGSNTVSGSVTNLTSLTHISITGANAISGSVAGLILLTQLYVTGKNTLSGSVTNLTSLTYLYVTGTNTLSGSIAGLTDLWALFITGLNTVTGSVNGLSSASTVYITGSNTVSGDISNLPVTLLYVTGENTLTYTGHVRLSNQWYFVVLPAVGSGWSVADITQAIIDNAAVTWQSSKVFTLTGEHSSMADTNPGGIWGDFSGPDSPSALATAFKTLVKTRGVNASLNGIVIPGVSGDGTGFPAGFGDWWRL